MEWWPVRGVEAQVWVDNDGLKPLLPGRQGGGAGTHPYESACAFVRVPPPPNRRVGEYNPRGQASGLGSVAAYDIKVYGEVRDL
jgi:hypothetical protein